MLFPYARIQRKGMPKIAGIYVLFEGLQSVLDDTLEEMTYSNAHADGTARRTRQKSTGGWLGITDKYWAAALIPDQKMECYRHAAASDHREQ